MSSFNFDSLVDALNKSGSDDDEELSSLDFKSLKKDSKKKRPKGRRGQEGPKKSIGKGPRKSIGKQTRCCKCHYIKYRDGILRKVRGPYSSCSYEMDNCCKDKKTIVKKKKKRKKKKSKRKTARR